MHCSALQTIPCVAYEGHWLLSVSSSTFQLLGTDSMKMQRAFPPYAVSDANMQC